MISYENENSVEIKIVDETYIFKKPFKLIFCAFKW